jgi:hypothetical protein
MALIINLCYVPFTFLVAYTTEAFSLSFTVRWPKRATFFAWKNFPSADIAPLPPLSSRLDLYYLSYLLG